MMELMRISGTNGSNRIEHSNLKLMRINGTNGSNGIDQTFEMMKLMGSNEQMEAMELIGPIEMMKLMGSNGTDGGDEIDRTD